MDHKNMVATIYLKDGVALKSPEQPEEQMDVLTLARLYNDSGVDKIICFDLSNDDEEHEKNILAIRQINRNIEIKTCGGGNIKRLEDVKKLLYAGCVAVVLNGSKPETGELLQEASKRFGPEKMLVSLSTMDFLFKTRDFLKENVHELVILNPDMLPGLENETDIPYIAQVAIGKLKQLQVFGNDYPTHDGTGVRDYIHVMDLAAGHLKAIEYAEENKGTSIFNLGTGVGYSVLDIVKAFEKANHVTIPYVITDRRQGDIAECYADPTLAQKMLHWKAERSLEEMCRDAWNWQKNNPQGF